LLDVEKVTGRMECEGGDVRNTKADSVKENVCRIKRNPISLKAKTGMNATSLGRGGTIVWKGSIPHQDGVLETMRAHIRPSPDRVGGV